MSVALDALRNAMPTLSTPVPDDTTFDPLVGTWLYTGAHARVAVWDYLRTPQEHRVVAMDTETPSTTDPFHIKTVTATWEQRGQLHTVLLDPLRCGEDFDAVQRLTAAASELVLHNAPFDVPGLYQAGLMDLEHANKVTDTLVLARLAFPDTMIRKRLSDLAARLLGLSELSGGMALAFKAAGFKTQEAGWRYMDIDRAIYRFGAMADTAITLRLLPALQAAAHHQLVTHPFSTYGCTTAAETEERIEWVHTVNRMMLRRNAVGLNYDPDYLDAYDAQMNERREHSEQILEQSGIRAGNGADLVKHLAAHGGLPDNWPRTKTGALSYAKEPLEQLQHPLAEAHRGLAHIDKILGYLGKCRSKAAVTGRIHPQCAVLGASATGRMSYSDPELQQFPEEARPIIIDDGQGLTSIDWSQIEPVTLANMARDTGFLEPYERGDDLYDLPMRAAGINRKTAKVVLLATMYGQGVSSLAGRIGHSEESAAQIRRQLLSAMPVAAKFMGRINDIAEQHGMVITAAGRVLPVPSDPKRGRVLAHKAVNYVVQGSACDVLMDAMVRCERAGLGDAILLPLHDELVVDTPAAQAIREIMLTPPQFLIRWAERTPVLRTDSADMGHCWKSV